MEVFRFTEFQIVKFCRASLMLTKGCSGDTYYISRRVFNRLVDNPKLPVTIVEHNINGLITKWLAVPMAF